MIAHATGYSKLQEVARGRQSTTTLPKQCEIVDPGALHKRNDARTKMLLLPEWSDSPLQNYVHEFKGTGTPRTQISDFCRVTRPC